MYGGVDDGGSVLAVCLFGVLLVSAVGWSGEFVRLLLLRSGACTFGCFLLVWYIPTVHPTSPRAENSGPGRVEQTFIFGYSIVARGASGCSPALAGWGGAWVCTLQT